MSYQDFLEAIRIEASVKSAYNWEAYFATQEQAGFCAGLLSALIKEELEHQNYDRDEIRYIRMAFLNEVFADMEYPGYRRPDEITSAKQLLSNEATAIIDFCQGPWAKEAIKAWLEEGHIPTLGMI